MNINASNQSLPNIITRTLMGRKEKRPTFDEVYKSISKNSAKMNSKMPLNSSLTNEQMFRCYVQNTVPKLQKSNDTFGENELNTVLMKLLGNDPSGNALTPTPLTTVAAAPSALTSAPSAPTGIPLPPPPPPPPPALPSGTSAPSAPTGIPLPPPPPSGTSAPPPSGTSASLTPLIIPPAMTTAQPAQSPAVAVATGIGATVMNLAATIFGGSSAQPTPPPPAPVLPPAAAATAFVSTTTPAPDPAKLARELAATQTLIDFNVVGLKQIISTRGAPLKPTTDPFKMEISAANQLINKIRVRKIDPNDLTGDLKINYERALELKRKVRQDLSASLAGTQAKKVLVSATKKAKEARRDTSLSLSGTAVAAGSTETKAEKQARIKADKDTAKAAAPPSTETPFEKKIRKEMEKAIKIATKIQKSAPIGAAKTAAKKAAKELAIKQALAALGGTI